MFYMHDVGWGWEFLMVIAMVGFWALVIYLVVWSIRGGTSGRGESSSQPPEAAQPPPPPPSAIEILDRRLANGELEIEEYQARREAIEQSRREVGAGT